MVLRVPESNRAIAIQLHAEAGTRERANDGAAYQIAEWS
jgi:hypothetical protein